MTVPTLVLYPNGDRWIRPASHQGLDRDVPDLEFIELHGGSHWITDQYPDLVTTQIAKFSAKHR